MILKEILFSTVFLIFLHTCIGGYVDASSPRVTRDVSESPEDETVINPLRFDIENWETNKLENLATFLSKSRGDRANITVVALENVYDSQGRVKHVNSIKLVIPARERDQIGVRVRPYPALGQPYRYVPTSQIEYLNKGLEQVMSNIHLPLSVTAEEYTESGEEVVKIFLKKNEVHAKFPDFSFYNKTIIGSTKTEVDNWISQARKQNLAQDEPTVLNYDSSGNLLESSRVYGTQLITLRQNGGNESEILLEAPAVAAKVGAGYSRSEVPKQLALAFNEKFPKYRWFTLVDVQAPDSAVKKAEFYVFLIYDRYDFNAEPERPYYYVYAVKKQ